MCIKTSAIVLYCIALYCTALHYTALHCIALHCIALHCIALHCIVLDRIGSYCIVLYCLLGNYGIIDLDDETRAWLENNALGVRVVPDGTRKKKKKL